MEIVVAGEPSARQQCVQANVSAVEQILFNLVDNACKYASAAEDKRIHVELRSLADGVEIRVRDHGPGLPPSRRKGWFRSFSKSAQEAAHRRPASAWAWRSAAAWPGTWAASCAWSPEATGPASCSR